MSSEVSKWFCVIIPEFWVTFKCVFFENDFELKFSEHRSLVMIKKSEIMSQEICERILLSSGVDSI